MPISKDGNNVVQETEFIQRKLFEKTGVAQANELAISDADDVLKQIKFDASAQATNTTTTLKSGAISSSVTLTLPAATGTVATNYVSHEYHVDPINGSDSNTGSAMAPFLTIGAACTAIGSAASSAEYNAVATSYYRIKLHPGITTESVAIPTRQLIELDISAGKIIGNVTWTIAGSVVTTFTQPKLIIHGSADFRSYPNTAAIPRTGINGTLTVTGSNMGGLTPQLHMSQTGVSGAVVFDSSASSFPCLFFGSNVVLQGGLTQTGSGQVTLNIENVQNSTTATSAVGQVTGNFLFNVLRNVNFNGLITDGANTLTGANWSNVAFANTSNDFTGSTFSVTADSSSWTSFLASFASGKRGTPTVTYSDTATALGYTPTTSANWNTVPTTALGGLNTLATSGVAKTQTANTILSGPTTGAATVPAFRALVGADLPSPSSSTLGGIQSYAAVSNQWINTISTSGVPASSQPAFTNISGTALATQGGTGLTTYTTGDVLYSSATNTLAKLAAGTTDQIQAQNSSGIPYWRDTISHRNELIFYEEWDAGANTGRNGWAAANSGSGSGAGNGTPVNNRPGVLLLTTGTTSTGYANRTAASGAGYFFGGGILKAEMAINLPILSTITEEYIFRGLLGDSITGADMVDGVYFVYDRLTNGDYWAAVTSSNSSRTTTVLDGGGGRATAAVSAAAWVTLSASVNAAGTSVVFSINDVAVATHTTNIPTTNARICAPAFHIVKSTSLGVASTVHIDYNYCKQVFTTPR